MSKMHDRHRERLDKKVKEYGLEMLEAHEQLEQILFAVIPRGDTNALAHRLLEKFRSVAGVLSADIEELMQIDGVGKRTAMFLHSLPALLGIVERNAIEKAPPRLYTPEERIAYAVTFFHGNLVESAYMFSLNSSYRLLSVDKLSEGKHDETHIYTGQAIRRALLNNASVVVFAHNHPCGQIAPSNGDTTLSRELKKAFAMVDIYFADSVIISGNEGFSMNQNGYLQNVDAKYD